MVRCSYCGKPAEVPDTTGDELDFLFSDVQQTEESAAQRKRGAKWGVFTRRRRSGEFNPFAVVLKLCYAALLIIIVIFVGRKFVQPLFQDGGLADIVFNPSDGEDDKPAKPAPDNSSKPEIRYGLQKTVQPGHMYVGSTPAGAGIYFMKEEDAPEEGRIYRHKDCLSCTGDSCRVRSDGTYVVEVVLPLRHPAFRDYPGYRELRRQIRDARSNTQKERLITQYFLQDGSVVLFDKAEGQEFIVRQYHNVVMHKERSAGVRALFLPRVSDEVGTGSSIARLIQDGIIPSETRYGFDVREVESELELYNVPKADWPFIIEALKRIGVIPYVTTDGKTRLFEIDIHRGLFGEKEICDAKP